MNGNSTFLGGGVIRIFPYNGCHKWILYAGCQVRGCDGCNQSWLGSSGGHHYDMYSCSITAKGQYATAMRPENQGSAAAEGLFAAWQPNQQGSHGIAAKGLEIAE